MFESTDVIVIPRDEYNALIRAQAIIDILITEHKNLASFDYYQFAGRLLGVEDETEAK
jgi:hypothetical protein